MLVLCSVAGAASTPGSSTVVVSMNVPGTTALNTTGCTTGTPGVTSFGVVHANTKAVTSLDCHIEFGASGSTATLQLAQTDGGGSAMWRLADGTPDPAFGGGDGVATANVLGDDVVVGAALGVDDSIYLLVDVGGSSQLRVAKFAPDGTTLDAAFGTGGVATTRVLDTDFDRAGIAVQPDGRVLIGGSGSGNDFRVERLTASGGQDASFGASGLATISIPDFEQAYALELRPDGRVLIGGYSAETSSSMGILLAQFTADGAPDPEFGGGDGWVVHWTGGGNAGAAELALLEDGRIMAVGWDMSSAYETMVARFEADGSIDTTFGGGDGIYTHALAGDDEGAGVAVDSAGRAYVVLHRANETLRIGRMTANGSGFDPAFGGGLVTLPFEGGTLGDGPRIPVVLPDDSVVVVGTTASSEATMMAARYRPDGTLDTNFGSAGIASIDAASGAVEVAAVAMLGIDGDVKVAGHAGAPGDVAVWSMHGAPLADYDDATGDDWSTGSASHFGACLRAASAGATGVWTEAGTCTAADGAEWQAVPTTAAPVATTTLSTSTAVAELRFGVRTAPAQAAGTYYAPLTFSVIAP